MFVSVCFLQFFHLKVCDFFSCAVSFRIMGRDLSPVDFHTAEASLLFLEMQESIITTFFPNRGCERSILFFDTGVCPIIIRVALYFFSIFEWSSTEGGFVAGVCFFFSPKRITNRFLFRTVDLVFFKQGLPPPFPAVARIGEEVAYSGRPPDHRSTPCAYHLRSSVLFYR